MHLTLCLGSFTVGKQLERRKQEDELKQVMQHEENFKRIKVGLRNYLYWNHMFFAALLLFNHIH